MGTFKAPHFLDVQLLWQLGLSASHLEAEQSQIQPLGSLMWLLLKESSLLMLIELVVNEKGLFYRAYVKAKIVITG